MQVHDDDLLRITDALRAAGEVLRQFASGGFKVRRKSGGSPVTDADLAVDHMLSAVLIRPGEGWLSEESGASDARLAAHRVWIVDPLDGTSEFVSHVPEWCVSIALVEDHVAVAGGIFNPASHQMVVGAAGLGVCLNGQRVSVSSAATLNGSTVLASRSEFGRGEWRRFQHSGFRVRPVGSIAYKLGLVAAGLADATWTLEPRHEWDVAAGVALVTAAGGVVRTLDWNAPRFNQPDTLVRGIAACGPGLERDVHMAIESAVEWDRASGPSG